MNELLFSATAPFTLDIPYHLYSTGPRKSKPLLIYLHGYKQNGMLFKRKVQSLFNINAYHLLLQGPYPIYDEKGSRWVNQWGRAWYLYDGNSEQFKNSLEKTSVFIDKILTEVLTQIKVNRTGIIGYSMGGYLAGYFGLSRSNLIDDMIVIGSRIKVEYFLNNHYSSLALIALHGKNDLLVSAHNQQKSCEALKQLGAAVTFKILDEGHSLTQTYLQEAKAWLLGQGYTTLKDV